MQLNAAPFLAGIARVQSSMRNLQAAAAGITGAFFAVRSAMANFQMVLEGVKGALDLGGRFNDMAASTGASVSELVLLTQAFQNSGLSVDAVGPMIARFQKALAGVNEEGQSTAGALQKLGINTLALSRMSVVAQFQELSRAFSEIEDPAERTRRAMELFGRSGAQMLALFRDPEAFSRAAAEIGTMGDVLEANAGKFDSMSDALTTIGQKMDQFFVGLASSAGAAGTLESIAKVDLTPMGQAVGSVGEDLAKWLPPMNRIEQFLQTAFPLFRQIQGAVDGIVIPKIAEAKAAAIDQNTQAESKTFEAKIGSVTSEEERVKVMNELGTSIDAVREKLSTVNTKMNDVPEPDRKTIAEALVRELDMLENKRSMLSQITGETMAANAAEADRAAAMAKSAAEAAKLAEQLDRTLTARDADAEKRVLAGLSPADAQSRVLGQMGLSNQDGLSSEINSLRSLGSDATDEQKARLFELIEAEKTLLGIKERQSQEDQKRAEQATRLSQLMETLSIDAERAAAEASGNTDKVRELDKLKAAKEMQRTFEAQGMSPEDAAKLAQAKAQLDQAASANAPSADRTLADAQRSIGLGGNAFSDQRRPQEEMVRKQQDANRLLADIKGLLSKQGPRVLLAETFD
jgi:hypothetical protein